MPAFPPRSGGASRLRSRPRVLVIGNTGDPATPYEGARA
ncbi:alpha/beta hydrolase, partial [Streptomyces sp. NPDC002215]